MITGTKVTTHDIELPQGYSERPFDYSGDLYIEGQVRAISEANADARVREALTEVAEMCDNVFSFSVGDSVRDLMYKMLSENNTINK